MQKGINLLEGDRPKIVVGIGVRKTICDIAQFPCNSSAFLLYNCLSDVHRVTSDDQQTAEDMP